MIRGQIEMAGIWQKPLNGGSIFQGQGKKQKISGQVLGSYIHFEIAKVLSESTPDRLMFLSTIPTEEYA